jgi:N-methylhydantoinase B/oxoprolinase/acetone carboxylase alpha subunit
MWNPPALQLKWGSYFREDVTEQASVVTMTVAAKTAGIITTQQAVEKLADIYGTDDAEAIVKALADEAAEKQQQAQEQMKAQAAANPKAPVQKPDE